MRSSGLSTARLGRMHDVMAGHVERGAMPGLVSLVSRRGEVHVEALGLQAVGGRPMRRDTIFRIASMTKPVAAVAAMILVEECRLRLDEPVDRLLPELADRKVLRRLDGPLDGTIPACRPITLRDLLTLRMGIGHIMKPSKGWPIQEALRERKLLQGPPRPQSFPGPDEWMRQVAELPLMHQPGEEWMYDLAMDVLGVLIARAADQPLETFLRERIFEPLGMKDTGFSVPPEKLDRLATSYEANHETGALEIYDPVEGSQWSRPPAFPSASGGLVSTADDFLAFGQMMLNDGRRGRSGNERILSRLSVEAMTADQLTPEQRKAARLFVGDNRGWGLGLAVVIRRDEVAAVPGRFGWDGALGTSWGSDPQEEMVAILMTQCSWTSPEPPAVWSDFWTSAYQAIDD
jgi:CubicO group peptidase (beta-lactamase class C family)